MRRPGGSEPARAAAADVSSSGRVKVRVYGSGARSEPSALRSAIEASVRGGAWLPRLPLLLYCAYLFWRHANDPFYFGLISGLNLGIHELGHYVWAIFGEFASILGGSLTQCLAPVIAMLMFLRQRDIFAIAFALCWLGSNFYGVATYAEDALVQQLDLVSPGSADPMHDWGYILMRWGMLSKAGLFGDLFRAAGALSFLAGLAGGAWVLWLMQKSGKETSVA